MKIIIGSKGKHISEIFKLGVILMVTTSMLGFNLMFYLRNKEDKMD